MRKLGSIAFNPNKKKRNKNVINSSLGRWGDLLASSDISSPVSVKSSFSARGLNGKS